MENLTIYNQARLVPDEAKKTIGAGRLRGFTDINPMWRLKKLTDLFGPCGIGWWYKITDKRIETDQITNQTAAFVDIDLYFVDPETGVVSQPIPGTGGSSFVSQERNGPYMSDECFKMALTDAISIATKALGFGADVYFDKDRSKYTNPPPSDSAFPAAKETAVEPVPVTPCADCGKELVTIFKRDGSEWCPEEIATYSHRRFGRVLCPACQKAAFKAEKEAGS